MYYEECVIGGIPCFRTSPNEEFQPISEAPLQRVDFWLHRLSDEELKTIPLIVEDILGVRGLPEFES